MKRKVGEITDKLKQDLQKIRVGSFFKRNVSLRYLGILCLIKFKKIWLMLTFLIVFFGALLIFVECL